MNRNGLFALIALVLVAAGAGRRLYVAEQAGGWQARREAAVAVERVVLGEIFEATQDAAPSVGRWRFGGQASEAAAGGMQDALGRLAARAAAAQGRGGRLVEVSGERFVVVKIDEETVVIDWGTLASEAESYSGASLSVGPRPVDAVPVLQGVLAGDAVWLDIAAVPMRTLYGGDLLAIGLFVWSCFELLRTLLRRARSEAAEGARVALLQRLSHELRTPAAAVRSLAEALRSGAARGQEADFLALIEQEAVRLASGIDRVLRAARGDLDVRVPSYERVDLMGLVEEIAQRWRRREPSIAVEGEGRLDVRADRAMLTEAIEALLDNALLHGAPPVWLRARREGGDVVLSIEDSGPGIPEADRERLLRRGEGRYTGIGLWAASEVASAHGGSLKLEGRCVSMRLSAEGAL